MFFIEKFIYSFKKTTKEGPFISISLWKASASFFKTYILRRGFGFNLVFNMFLVFHQTSGSCSDKIVLLKSSVCIVFYV